MAKKKISSTLLVLIIIFTFFTKNKDTVPIEDLSIPALSILNTSIESKETFYTADSVTYNYKPQSVVEKIKPRRKSVTPGESRHLYDLQSRGVILPGMQKVILFGEDICSNGLDTTFSMLFASKSYNDLSYCGVLTMDSIQFLETKIPGNDNLTDYVEGLIKTCHYDNFFKDRFKLKDMYYNLANEGYNLILPHISLKESFPIIDGVVLFKKNYLCNIVPLQETRILNLLRESNVSGNVSLKESEQSVDCIVDSKRLVKYEKKDDKYYFTINLKLNGDIYQNTLYDNLSENNDLILELENKLENKVLTECNFFIHKMQTEYNIDALNLGRYIIANEGINKNIDWDTLVCNAEIKVNVDFKIRSFGRGEF